MNLPMIINRNLHSYIRTFVWIGLLIISLSGVGLVHSCEYLQISDHPLFGNIYFQQIPIDSPDLSRYHIQESGRPSYVSIENDGRYTKRLYLLHVSDSFSGEGRWIFTTDLAQQEKGIIGYLRSWAILPYLYRSAQDSWSRTHWYFLHHQQQQEDNYFYEDQSFQLNCFNDVDKTVFIQTEVSMSPRLDGYYVERFLSTARETAIFSPEGFEEPSDDSNSNNDNSRSVYTQIKFMESDRQLYLYRLAINDFSAKWLIGFDYGVDSAYAFCEDATNEAITVNNLWNILDQFAWRVEESMQVLSVLKFTQSYEFFSPTSQDLPEILRQIRSILPYTEDERRDQMYSLRNQVAMPMVGLGTGGIYREETAEVLDEAIELGYRLFDLAREYRNEDIVGHLLKEKSPSYSRHQFFLESKVWPTQLGFLPTTNAIIDSLHDLQTSYLDLYLLHWPECDPKVDWMHCETTIDPKGTWRESWFALEKAYSEGRLMSIGFSNANRPLLEELGEFATILPHVIQNWSEIGQIDYDVREWCEEHESLYQPYAAIRNLRFQPSSLRNQVQMIARNHNVTEEDVNLRFFLQTGAGLIPRSTNSQHLRENLQKVFQWSLTDEEMMDLGWKLTIHHPISNYFPDNDDYNNNYSYETRSKSKEL